MSCHGWLVIDKPLGLSSRAAVNRMQRWFPRRTPLGHTGTLDPLATGVLVLAVGKATRLADYVQASGKVYESTFIFGATSATDDAEGPITPYVGSLIPTMAEVRAALDDFVGLISQVPPAFSAIQVEGRRAYADARAGKSVTLAPRTIRIDRIDVIAYDYPNLIVRIACGKGTYIRSLARDLGEKLGVGGYVGALRRTAVGGFNIEGAVDLESPPTVLRPLLDGLPNVPTVSFSSDESSRLCHGGFLSRSELGEFACLDPSGDLIAIGHGDGTTLRPTKVLAG